MCILQKYVLQMEVAFALLKVLNSGTDWERGNEARFQ
jgi:hypothetical protein